MNLGDTENSNLIFGYTSPLLESTLHLKDCCQVKQGALAVVLSLLDCRHLQLSLTNLEGRNSSRGAESWSFTPQMGVPVMGALSSE